MTTWRLLDTPPMTAAENMALDEALVDLKGRGRTPDTIRFCVSSPGASWWDTTRPCGKRFVSSIAANKVST